MTKRKTLLTAYVVLIVVSVFIDVALNGLTNAQATLGPNNFTGTQSVNVATGDAIVGVTGDIRGRAVHGIGGIGGQFETGTGFILLGRGQGFDRFAIDSLGNTTTRGDLRVDGGVSVGGANTFAVDAPGVVGGRFQILANGIVTIGTPTPLFGPSTKLDVAGDVRVSGKLQLDLEYVDSAQITVTPRTVGSVSATCPGGKQAIGGGFDIGGPGVNAARTLASTPGTGPGRWIVRVANDPGPVGGADITVMASAVCASIF